MSRPFPTLLFSLVQFQSVSVGFLVRLNKREEKKNRNVLNVSFAPSIGHIRYFLIRVTRSRGFN